MSRPVSASAMPAELLLLLRLIMAEGDRLEEYPVLAERLCDFLGVPFEERALLHQGLSVFGPDIGTAATTRALRALTGDERAAVEGGMRDFAATDPLLGPRLDRVMLRVADVLDPGKRDAPPG